MTIIVPYNTPKKLNKMVPIMIFLDFAYFI